MRILPVMLGHPIEKRSITTGANKMKTIKAGDKVRLKRASTGKAKGNLYRVLAINGNKATLKPGVLEGKEKIFRLKDLI